MQHDAVNENIESLAIADALRDDIYGRAYDAEMHRIREERARRFQEEIRQGIRKPFEFNLHMPAADDPWEL